MITLQSGTLFAGRYEVISRLGAGGMGAVYLICDPRKRDMLLALKVLDESLLKSEATLARFRNEITASRGVKHPNIVQAFEYFDEPELQAYVMEYVDGGTLRKVLAAGPRSASFAAEVLLQVSSGLEAVHSQKIIHRDLKPENLLVSKKGLVKISDFGVARLQDAQSVTHIGSLVGTAQYVPPEYVETGECDHRGDIYALGIIGYETLVGASPFPSHSTVSKILERFGTPPPPLKQAVPSCPDELAGIIARAMNVRISERYQTASELRQDLERFIENHYFEKRSPHSSMPQGGSRSPDPLVETVRLPSQAHLLKRKPDRIKTLILALGGLLLGMVALAAFYAWKTAPKAPPQEENIQDVRDQILGP